MAHFQLIRVAPPAWATQPSRRISCITVEEYAAIQRHRDKLLNVVHCEVEAYLNDPTLVFETDEDGFPNRGRMTGAYYIADESYIAHRDEHWFQISVMCHFLEFPKPGMNREDDYLGLEVWLKCVPGQWHLFEVFRNTDSSSI
jgi:hypothetical protein